MVYYNRFGEVITGVPSLRNSKWYRGKDFHGWPIVDWENNIINGDSHGFDQSYKIKTVELPIGTRILRYSREAGRYSAPIGTPYDCLALPYELKSIMYNEYEVLRPFPVTLIPHKGFRVQQGIVAKGFDVIGGGIQYLHDELIEASVNKGLLRRLDVSEWSTNIEKE